MHQLGSFCEIQCLNGKWRFLCSNMEFTYESFYHIWRERFIILDRVNLTRNSHIIGSQLNVVAVGLVLSMSGVKAVLVSSLVRFSCGLTCVLTSELSDEMLCCSDHIRRVSLQCESSDEP